MLKKGFTLIELLVVVAIIGLISTIVLVNMRGSRAKARDVNIQSYMHQLRNAAEINYLRTETYAQVCNEPDDTLKDKGDFGILEKAIERENGGQDVRCFEFEGPGRTSFAASSPLVGREGKHWCIESAGLSIEIDNEITSAKCE